jgi:glycosyltransferase involved in cell wall biosynthesis
MVEFSRMTLGVISHKDLWMDPQGVKTTGGFGRQVEEFSCHFNRMVLLVPFEEKKDTSSGYVIQIEKLQIIPFPRFNGTGLDGKLDFLLKLPGILLQIWRAYPQCDIWQFRLPSYVGLLGVVVHRLRRSRPAFIWLGTDWPERIRESGDTPVRRWMAWLAKALLTWAACDIPTFVLGGLAMKYGPSNPFMHSTVSTIISLNDFAVRIKAELASPPRLLFVGRLAVEKGLPDLLQALYLGRHQNLSLDLTIIGDGPERANLGTLVDRYGLQKWVHFEGYIPAGDTLWQFYNQADIFILPALSEAQGKVLIEAMAAGLPIIATRVGGIPSVIQHGHNGLLVEPHLPLGILAALQNLLGDPALRQRLVSNAFASARGYTIDVQTDLIIQQLARDFAAQGWGKP